MNQTQWTAMGRVLQDVAAERERQHAKWGEQSWPDGTGGFGDDEVAHFAKADCEAATRAGLLTYRHILAEEFAEALAELDKAALREELVQVAAVAVAWVEKLDREAGR